MHINRKFAYWARCYSKCCCCCCCCCCCRHMESRLGRNLCSCLLHNAHFSYTSSLLHYEIHTQRSASRKEEKKKAKKITKGNLVGWWKWWWVINRDSSYIIYAVHLSFDIRFSQRRQLTAYLMSNEVEPIWKWFSKYKLLEGRDRDI